MDIPTGSWMVVMRHCRDNSSRGEIILSGLNPVTAKLRAQSFNVSSPDWHYWAIEKSDY